MKLPFGFAWKTAIGLIVLVFTSSSTMTPYAYAVRLKAETVTLTGLSTPVFAAAPEGQSGVLYVAEEFTMAVKILDLQTKAVSTFIDLPGNASGQLGLQAIAFHPDYATNGKFYMNVSDPQDNHIKIYEATRSSTDPMVADLSTLRVMYSFPNPSGGHNGGWLGFSPIDEYLYIATGDGGAIGPPNFGLPAQDVNDPKGKILRIDVNGDDFPTDETRNYSIPADNPFASGGGAPEVFALGLRHPYTNAFDSANGDLYIADVGSVGYEEVNLLPAGTTGGQNFGWRALEGPFDNPQVSDPAPPGAIDPIYYYSRNPGAAIIAADVYRGSAIPELQGHFVFGDFVREEIWSLKYDGESVTDVVNRTVQLANPAISSYAAAPLFGTDADGEIYIIDRGRGDIFKIVADPMPADYNEDGVVNAADYALWRDTLASNSLLAADGNGNGLVDQEDYNIWASQFHEGVELGSKVVPEPGSISLALAILAILGVSRRLR